VSPAIVPQPQSQLGGGQKCFLILSTRRYRFHLDRPRSAKVFGISKTQGDTAGATKEPEPPNPIRWNMYKIASEAVWLDEVEALDDTAAMEKAVVNSGAGQYTDGVR
jgi:hypothetical protein